MFFYLFIPPATNQYVNFYLKIEMELNREQLREF